MSVENGHTTEKAGTSTGGKIEYSPAEIKYQKDSLLLVSNSEGNGVEVSVELASVINVHAGQKIELSFYRDEIAADYKGHILRLFDTNGNLITNADLPWCTKDTYPGKSAGTVQFAFSPDSDIAVKKFVIFISGDAFTSLNDFEISKVKITVQ